MPDVDDPLLLSFLCTPASSLTAQSRDGIVRWLTSLSLFLSLAPPLLFSLFLPLLISPFDEHCLLSGWDTLHIFKSSRIFCSPQILHKQQIQSKINLADIGKVSFQWSQESKTWRGLPSVTQTYSFFSGNRVGWELRKVSHLRFYIYYFNF